MYEKELKSLDLNRFKNAQNLTSMYKNTYRSMNIKDYRYSISMLMYSLNSEKDILKPISLDLDMNDLQTYPASWLPIQLRHRYNVPRRKVWMKGTGPGYNGQERPSTGANS